MCATPTPTVPLPTRIPITAKPSDKNEYWLRPILPEPPQIGGVGTAAGSVKWEFIWRPPNNVRSAPRFWLEIRRSAPVNKKRICFICDEIISLSHGKVSTECPARFVVISSLHD